MDSFEKVHNVTKRFLLKKWFTKWLTNKQQALNNQSHIVASSMVSIEKVFHNDHFVQMLRQVW